MKLQESGEMYLETILRLSKEKELVRSIDVAEYMDFSKPSVSRAIGLLKDGGLLTVEAGGALVLTDNGKKVAEAIYERHQVLTRFLTSIGVEEDVAEEPSDSTERKEFAKHDHK